MRFFHWHRWRTIGTQTSYLPLFDGNAVRFVQVCECGKRRVHTAGTYAEARELVRSLPIGGDAE